MRVAFDHQAFLMQRYGGVSRYFVELLAHLSATAGVEPTVIAPFYISQYLHDSPAARAQVRGLYCPFCKRRAPRAIRQLTRALLPWWWRTAPFDVIHETYYAARARGRAGARVLTLFDLIHERYPAEFSDAAAVISAKRLALARADHVLCISESTRQDAISLLGIEPSRTSVTYLGSDIDRLTAHSAPLSGLGPFLLYVGARNPYKNFPRVLEGFALARAHLAGWRLLAFGGKAFTAAELALCQKLGISADVVHLNGSDALLKGCYQRASALVYPSRYEGFGLPPLEAMLCGCPVLASRGGSIPEVLGDAGAYFDAEDGAALAVLMRQIAEDPAFAATLRARGTARAQRFSWAQCAAQTLAVYRRLCA